MNQADFTVLYNLVTSGGSGWEAALVAAWPCLTQDQKHLLHAAV